MILFVDDDLRFLRSFIEELELEGLSVTTASSVAEASRILAGDEPIQVVILDIMMPWPAEANAEEKAELIHGGFGLFREIRADKPDLPVILFTNAHSAKDLVIEDRTTRFCHKVDYLPHEFARFVKELLETLKRT